jgi:hypothetical protein
MRYARSGCELTSVRCAFVEMLRKKGATMQLKLTVN